MPKGNMPKRKPTAAQTSGRGSGRTTAASRARSAEGSSFHYVGTVGTEKGPKGRKYVDWQEVRVVAPKTRAARGVDVRKIWAAPHSQPESMRKVGKPERIYFAEGTKVPSPSRPSRKNTGSR